MEGRPNRVRGGSWKRGGGGSNDSGSSGENRGRGRGHHRGRGKRDHYRGRGRGGGAPASGFHRDQDEGIDVEDEGMEEIFRRRKLESNWERYKESEKPELEEDTPTQRGTDFQVLLESAGDSFSQFRFSEEKEWEMDSLAANLISAVFVDLPALAECLQELPLHQRLNLEAEIVQESTPVDLPTMTMVPKQDPGVKGWFKPTVPAQKGPISSLSVSCAACPVSGTAPLGSSSAAKPPMDDMDDDLDQLLSLQRPVSEPSESKPIRVMEMEEEEEEEEVVVEVCIPDKPEERTDEQVSEEQEKVSPKAEAAKQQMTEDDLEDWLDSMIS